MQCNAMQCNAMQCNAMQCNAMQCETTQHNTYVYIYTYIPFIYWLLTQGVCTTVHQPTLVNLEILLHTDIATVGATYIGGSLGYMLGAIASGGAMDRYNREFLFATSGVIVALGTILLPWSPHIGVFGVIYSVRSIAMGAIDAGKCSNK